MIIAIDGPAAAGKGTLTRKLAKYYNLALLDTGLIYRAVGLKAVLNGDPSDSENAIQAAKSLDLADLKIHGIRGELAAKSASLVAAIPAVRDVLLEFQREFAHNPPDGKIGSILDGRDIGTVVCPDAKFKLFITASLEVRTDRRYKELQERGEEAIRSAVLDDIKTRDERDIARALSPLKPAGDALIIDSSDFNASEVFSLAQEFIKSQMK